jgi:hypothetical protein
LRASGETSNLSGKPKLVYLLEKSANTLGSRPKTRFFA